MGEQQQKLRVGDVVRLTERARLSSRWLGERAARGVVVTTNGVMVGLVWPPDHELFAAVRTVRHEHAVDAHEYFHAGWLERAVPPVEALEKIGPGFYVDRWSEQPELHVFADLFFRDTGYADTPANRLILDEAIQDVMRRTGCVVSGTAVE